MIHVLPINDIREHTEETCCECCPTVEWNHDEGLVIHNSFDGRELQERQPRLFGVWEPAFFGSGTTIVRTDDPRKPHLYVYADVAVDDDRYMSDRYQMCYQLAEYMNGGERPAWLDDFERTDEYSAASLAGGQIFATGPSIDVDPPNLNWVQDDSDDAKNNRARLMDAVFIPSQQRR